MPELTPAELAEVAADLAAIYLPWTEADYAAHALTLTLEPETDNGTD